MVTSDTGYRAAIINAQIKQRKQKEYRILYLSCLWFLVKRKKMKIYEWAVKMLSLS